jgi:hypothetical protein
VWRFIDGRRCVAEIMAEMHALYGTAAERMAEHVHAFLSSLRDNDLVVIARSVGEIVTGAREVAAHKEAIAGFEAPELVAYTDMQELLLLDPIHEVDERGWPHANSETKADD